MNAISIVIPTYRREGVLLDTLHFLLALPTLAAEILVMDQTEDRGENSAKALQALHDAGRIVWVRLPHPSITHAMNQGLLRARHDIVLFLDDDIRPEPLLVQAHAQAHARGETLVAGRVIQPWEEGRHFVAGGPFKFAGIDAQELREFMGGNFSVRRGDAVALGGFDENFVRVAYRFEAEFAHRWRASGRRIRFEPDACIHHLKAGGGGTRAFGDHLTTSQPAHAVGAYYYALLTGSWRDFLARPVRSVIARFYVRHPWLIPGRLLAEARGMRWAMALHRAGPKHIAQGSSER